MSREDRPSERDHFDVARFPDPEGPWRGVDPTTGRFLFDFGDFRAAVAAVVEAGGLRITSIDIRANDVTSARHRALPIRVIRSEIERRYASHDLASALAGILRATGRDIPEELLIAEKRAAEAAKSLDPNHPAQVALHYLNAYNRDPRRPIALMAEELGRSPNTVSGWVRKCRDDGWLTRETGDFKNNQQGRAGGAAGPRLIEWMEGQ